MSGTIYPDGIDGFTQLPLVSDTISPIVADDINRLRNAIVSIETELGINPSGTFGTVKTRVDALESLLEGLTGVENINIDFISATFDTPVEKTYRLAINVPYGGVIDSISSITSSGTTDYDITIDGVALPGGSNSASSVESTEVYLSGNIFTTGQDLSLVISNASSPEDLNITIIFVRV